MDPSRPDAEEIFHEASKLTDPRQREDYLARVCNGDPQLRSRINALLKAEAEADGFLGTDGPSQPPPDPAS